MKISRVVIIAFCALINSTIVQAELETCCSKKRARTFMFTRPLNQNLPLYDAVWHDFIYEKPGKLQISTQMAAAVQASLETQGSNEYFLFCKRDYLLAAGDDSPNKNNREVRAEWLQLPTTFSGTIKLKPRQRQYAVFFHANKELSDMNISFLEDYWIDISAPIIVVDNKLIIEQQIGSTTTTPIINDTGRPQPFDFITAFNRSDLAYARIPQEGTSAFGIAEIKIKFGKTYMAEDHYQIVYYSGISIPTAPSQNAKYVFDAVAGNNGHFGIIAGVEFQIVTSRCDLPYVTCFFLNVENLFLAHSYQHRTFDLKEKPWSRYLLLNNIHNGPNQNIPASNVLTRKASVHPYSMVDSTLGGRLFYSNLICELGCNIWAHGREKVELHECFPPVWGIAGKKDDRNPGFATTASNSTITNRIANMGNQQFDIDADGNPIFIPIRECDIDYRSAGTKESLTFKAYVSFGWGFKGRRMDGFLGIGGWYEVPHAKSVLMTAGTWAKLGASF